MVFWRITGGWAVHINHVHRGYRRGSAGGWLSVRCRHFAFCIQRHRHFWLLFSSSLDGISIIIINEYYIDCQYFNQGKSSRRECDRRHVTYRPRALCLIRLVCGIFCLRLPLTQPGLVYPTFTSPKQRLILGSANLWMHFINLLSLQTDKNNALW